MMHTQLRDCVAAATVIAWLSFGVGCGSKQQAPSPPESLSQPLEPIVPPGYQKIAPAGADTSLEILSQTAAIIQGDLKEADFTYDTCAGPRTNYVLSGVRTLAGTDVGAQVTIRVLGGRTPNGSYVRVSELPVLALDSQYVVFLRKTDWTLSPVVGDMVFRRENIGGREVLIHPEGHAVTGWGDSGPILSAAPVTEPVGRRVRGYRGATAPGNPQGAPSSLADAAVQATPVDGNAPPPGQGHPPVVSSGSPLAQAPSLADLRASGMFARPAVLESAAVPEAAWSAERLLAAVREASSRDNISINGRVTLHPLWRCWGITKTVPASR